MTVLDDIAEGVRPDLRAVVVQMERRRAVGNPNLADRFGLGGKPVPDADRVQDGPGAPRDRRYPAVERGCPHRRCRSPVDDRDIHSGAAERGGEGQPDHAAPADDHLEVHRRPAVTIRTPGRTPGSIRRAL